MQGVVDTNYLQRKTNWDIIAKLNGAMKRTTRRSDIISDDGKCELNTILNSRTYTHEQNFIDFHSKKEDFSN